MVLWQSYQQSVPSPWTELRVWHEVVIYVRLLACRVGPTEVHHVSSCSELQMILKQVGDDFATPCWQEWSPLPRVRRGVAKSPGRRHGCDFCLETRWGRVVAAADFHSSKKLSQIFPCSAWPHWLCINLIASCFSVCSSRHTLHTWYHWYFELKSSNFIESPVTPHLDKSLFFQGCTGRLVRAKLKILFLVYSTIILFHFNTIWS